LLYFIHNPFLISDVDAILYVYCYLFVVKS
jgi:hypothetical protein